MQSDLQTPIGGKSVVNAVIDRITNAIIRGELAPGSRIPTEMELSQKLNVSRNSVREAIKALVYIGVLDIRRSEGTFVRSSFSDQMLNPLLYSLMLENHFSESLIELRRIFEIGSLQLAIQKATDDDISGIGEACSTLTHVLDEENTGPEKILEADIQFHQAIISAAHNPLVNRISFVITELTRPSRNKTIINFLGTNRQRFMIDSHQRMYDIIKNRDNAAVIDTVDYHYSFWEEWIHKNISDGCF